MTRRTDEPSAAVRIRVLKRDRFRCTYCGTSGNDSELEIDHIVPVSKGGSNHASNLTTACRTCNQRKGAGAAPLPQGEPVGYGLVGLFLWTLVPDPAATQWRAGVCPAGFSRARQGEIFGRDGDYALVQWYSHWDGSPTTVGLVLVTDLANPERAVLFRNRDDFLARSKALSEIEFRERRRT